MSKKKVDKKPCSKTESIYQFEHRLKEEARIISENNIMSDNEKIKNGTHKWTVRIGKYGIKENVLLRII